MKISNEVKVGILAVVAILALVFGFNFLKGKSLFNKTPTLYAVFPKLGSLQKSNEVKINGLTVGTVYDFVPTTKDIDNILVEIHLNRDISIPLNSTAFIDGALVGASYINIEKGNAKTYLQAGDTISTRLEAGLMSDIKTQLSPTITRVNETLDSLKYVIGSVNQVFDPSTNNNLQSLISHLTLSAAHLQRLLNTETGLLAQGISNLNSVTGNLAKNNDAVSQSIRNVEITTSNLANARIPEVVSALEGTITNLKGTAAQLNSTISKINTNKGTLGLLMNDRKLYDQLSRSALAAEILIDDLRIHPKRYVNISVFGGKEKGEALTSPTTKDSIVVNK